MKRIIPCLILFCLILAVILALFYPKQAEEATLKALQCPTTNVNPPNDSGVEVDIKSLVVGEFGPNSRMVKVAECESQFRQFDEGGNVLHGRVNPKDIGIFQINEDFWLATAIKLGYDIYTVKGNIAMAKYIQSVAPDSWYLSEGCWGKL